MAFSIAANLLLISVFWLLAARQSDLQKDRGYWNRFELQQSVSVVAERI
jgi:hypothetical protein